MKSHSIWSANPTVQPNLLYGTWNEIPHFVRNDSEFISTAYQPKPRAENRETIWADGNLFCPPRSPHAEAPVFCLKVIMWRLTLQGKIVHRLQVTP